MKVVIFTENNARVLHVDDVTPFKDNPNAVINPDLKAVAGLPPHFWKFQDGKIVSMGRPEKVLRIAHIDAFGSKNDHNVKLPVKTYHLTLTITALTLIPLILGGVIGYLIRG